MVFSWLFTAARRIAATHKTREEFFHLKKETMDVVSIPNGDLLKWDFRTDFSHSTIAACIYGNISVNATLFNGLIQ